MNTKKTIFNSKSEVVANSRKSTGAVAPLDHVDSGNNYAAVTAEIKNRISKSENVLGGKKVVSGKETPRHVAKRQAGKAGTANVVHGTHYRGKKVGTK